MWYPADCCTRRISQQQSLRQQGFLYCSCFSFVKNENKQKQGPFHREAPALRRDELLGNEWCSVQGLNYSWPWPPGILLHWLHHRRRSKCRIGNIYSAYELEGSRTWEIKCSKASDKREREETPTFLKKNPIESFVVKLYSSPHLIKKQTHVAKRSKIILFILFVHNKNIDGLLLILILNTSVLFWLFYECW